MARSRNIKPGFFANEELTDLPYGARLLFIGLWTLADREGRLEDRPKRIRGELFRFDKETNASIDGWLNLLASRGFISRYAAGGDYIQITNFSKHQNPHKNEIPSVIPAMGSEGLQKLREDSSNFASAPEKAQSTRADSLLLIPDSLQSDSADATEKDSCQPEELNRLELAIRDAAEKIHSAHPQRRRDCGVSAVAKNLTAIIARHCKRKTGPEKAQFLAAVVEEHAEKAISIDWQKEGGEFAKGLSNYLAPTLDRYLPTERKQAQPPPTASNGKHPHDAETVINRLLWGVNCGI